jgi:hypothetical protein
MRHLLISVTAALAIAGCAAERQDAGQTTSTPKQAAATTLPRTTAVPSVNQRSSFASRPDRGALLAYSRDRQTFRRGAHTYHAVDLSEAHALNAVAPGRSISLTTPSGENLQIAYQRHEESIDGNWTWVGKTREGYDAVITFGEKAVFGRISRPDTEPLRLTMAAGRAWMVETDPSRMYDGDTMRTSSDNDVLIPPNVAANIIAKKQAAAATSEAVPVKSTPATTVDVVLGFTNGLATRLGGTSQATTRLANLMALTNQAYVNSQVTSRVRLVHTLQVAYTDSNSNETALEALTGFTCTTSGCTAQTVPAELVPLRTARETYGGDLVSLLRPLLAPQHTGCGIAWLLGGGGFAIDASDAPFGYSVVSDGSDVDEGDGRTYNCRDEALAHELGHNMGQQHNVEDSGGDSGTHPYSYGYREASTTGFYTIMAYRLSNSSQFSINYFGNPSVNYADTGRPTGTANANNAASLNLSMPLVVQFRNAVVPFGTAVVDDMNGDGRSDILWRRPASNQTAVWQMNGAVQTGFTVGTGQAGYSIVGTGDFNGDGRIDILWDNGGTLILWTSNGGTGFTASNVTSYGDGWQYVTTTDANGDGRADIIWSKPSQNLIAYWYMNGAAISGTGILGAVPGSSIIGAGDFNGDGRFDLLWDNGGTLTLWTSTGTSFTSTQVAAYGDGWKPEAVADVNGDGRMDIIWRKLSTNQIAYWFMNGATITGSGVRGGLAGYNIIGSGDFNGDGRFDLLWDNNGTMYMWLSTGTDFTSSLVASYGDGWQPWRNALKRLP